MKLDTMIQMINDLRIGSISDDTDPANILVESYVTPFDVLGVRDSVRVSTTNNTTVFTWSDGTTYIKTDSNGDPYDAPSCNWLWGVGGRYPEYPTAVVFDGVDDYIDCGSTALFSTSSPGSVTGWFKVSAYSPAYLPIVVLKTNASTGFSIFVSAQATYTGLNFGSDTNFTQGRSSSFTGNEFINNWYHFALIYNGLGPTNLSNYTLYINGVADTVVAAGPQNPVSNLNLIGLESPNYFNGAIKGITVYNRTLSAIEVSAIYSGSVPLSGLTSEWRLSEGAGVTTNDSTGNGNTGTLINGPRWL